MATMHVNGKPVHVPDLTYVYCPLADDADVVARDGFCSVCGSTEHEVAVA